LILILKIKEKKRKRNYVCDGIGEICCIVL